MGNIWDAQRHEDKYSVGIPDVSYGVNGVNGWIELKAYKRWPRCGLIHFTPKQVNWLTKRGRAGGHCFIMVKINNCVMLFDWSHAHFLMKECSKKSMKEKAIKIWEGSFIPDQFIKIIGMENDR